MKEQTFKFDHMTVVYHGAGQYTLISDEGYVLQSGDKQVREVKTKDYTQWKAVEAPAAAPKPSFDEAQGTPAPKKPRAKKTGKKSE